MSASSSISGRLSTVALLLLPLVGGCLHVGRPPSRADPGVCGASLTSLVPWAHGEALLGDALARACVGLQAPTRSGTRLTIVAAGWDDATNTGSVPTREVVVRLRISREGAREVSVEARRRLALGTRAGASEALLQATLVQLAEEVALRSVRIRPQPGAGP